MNLSSNKIEPLLITAVNIAARAVHLVFFIAIGNKYGSTELTDSVYSLLAPLVILTGVATGVAETVAMPVFHKLKNKNEVKYVFIFFLRKIVICISASCIVVSFVSSILYHEKDYLTVSILSLIPFFASLTAIKIGILNASNKFKAAVSGPLFGASAATFFLLVCPIHIYFFASSFLVFEIAKLIGLSFFRDISHGGVPEKTVQTEKVIHWGYKNAKIQLAASFVMALIYPVDVWFAKSLSETGAVTFVEYANKLWNLIPLLFTGHIALVYAYLSKTASTSGESFRKINIHSIAFHYMLLGTTAGIIVIFTSDYIVSLLFGSGKITAQQQIALSSLLKSYLFGSGFYIGGLVYVRALSALGNVNILLAITSFSVVCNIFYDYILIKISGLTGIGMATSLVYASNYFLLIFYYEKNRLAIQWRS
ncbi:MAG: lipid II flippase MurJ [Candidatus Electronema sp. V4]|uniref:lipid II flippase MurJ n=1 Tax=Candidatus Electronema sp. V4 TaxID=3454756 RepID=UPI0040553AE7